MPFEPRVPLVLAEQVVDFPRVNDHVLRRRKLVEEGVQPVARRIAFLVAEIEGLVPIAVGQELGERLTASLAATARFGFDSARAELRLLRRVRPVKAYAVPDAGAYAEAAAGGMESVRELIKRRGAEAGAAITREVVEAGATAGLTKEERAALLAATAQRATHNFVLELVGETLNLGRSAGVLSLSSPPEFAMRSEQLDKTTCFPCSSVHGEIVQLGSSEYYDLTPPALCLGAGRCRGLWVYADEEADMRLPEAA